MKFYKVLEEILGKKSNVSILRVLISRGIELTGRQVAELAGLNHRTCLLSLEELKNQGLVLRRSAGTAYLYSLRLSNIFFKEGIEPLFKLEKELAGKMTALLLDALNEYDSGNQEVLSVTLFGSVASKKEEPDSDIDVCLIIKDIYVEERLRDILSDVNDRVMDSFGNELSFYIVTAEKLREMKKVKSPLIAEISEGQTLRGVSLESLK